MSSLWGLLLITACGPAPPPAGDREPATAVTAYLGEGGAEGFARALTPGALSFPADHAAHPAYRTEWWYFTGNLQTPAGRHFGFQLTFFRFALTARSVPRHSRWATPQLWMAHFALTDTESGRHQAHERLSRGALGLAGATGAPFRLWLDDWKAAANSAAFLPLRLHAHGDETALELELAVGKPHVLQGDAGLVAKGPQPGNASYYYSFSRLPASGRVRLDDAWFEVSGTAWMDHEWSTAALGVELAGWDWFALQLDDQTELMFYRLRGRDGAMSPFSGGRWVNADGSSEPIAAQDIVLQPLASWQGPETGARYPTHWRLTIPRRSLSLRIAPRIEDQEMPLSVRYWEGAVLARGEFGGEPLTGEGYLELTGY